MITERFSQLLTHLVSRWTDYQDAPRDPRRVADLASARVALDEARTEIAAERALIVRNPTPQDNGRRVAVSDADLLKLRVAAIGLDGTA